MPAVAEIAKRAFDGVAASTDAVKAATLTDGVQNYSGRVVFGSESAPAGFPLATPKDKVRPVYLEGFGAVPGPGWSFAAGSETFYVLGIRDIVKAGSFIVANVIAQADMLWKAATFQQPQRVSDGARGFTVSWADLQSTNIGVLPASGREVFMSERTEARGDWRALVPFIAGLTEECRAVIDGKPYNIRFAEDVEMRGVWQILDMQSGVAT